MSWRASEGDQGVRRQDLEVHMGLGGQIVGRLVPGKRQAQHVQLRRALVAGCKALHAVA